VTFSDVLGRNLQTIQALTQESNPKQPEQEITKKQKQNQRKDRSL
jgi:hypothetical protein